MEEAQQIDQRLLGRRALQRRARQVGHVVGHEEGARPGGASGVVVAPVGQERDLIGASALQRGHTGDDPGGIAIEPGVERFRELAEREPGRGHRRYGFFTGAAAGAGALGPFCRSYSRMTSSVRSASAAP